MKTILIVEDNPSHMRLAKALLQRFGYATLSAENADSGLRLAREQHPDLVLMDMQLPDMDGLAATRLLKSDAATCAIPVVAVTSFLADHSEPETRRAGCTAFIAKPYHHSELRAVLEAALAG